MLASTIVHLAETGTTLAAGIAHHRLRNVDWRAAAWLGIPGGAGALVGALALTRMDASVARPFMSTFLLVLGGYALIRTAASSTERTRRGKLPARFLTPLGFIAGCLDGAGGGGWGALGTATLLASRRMEPRTVVGTMDTSEFVVATCASVGFLLGLGAHEVPWAHVGAVLGGGIVAAPVAAWIVRKLRPRALGIAIGAMLVATNLHNVARALDLGASTERVVLVALAIAVAAVLVAFRWIRRERRARAA